MLQLARGQDQTNRQLQQHIQLGQANMQDHTRGSTTTAYLNLSKKLQSYICKYTYI